MASVIRGEEASVVQSIITLMLILAVIFTVMAFCLLKKSSNKPIQEVQPKTAIDEEKEADQTQSNRALLG